MRIKMIASKLLTLSLFAAVQPAFAAGGDSDKLDIKKLEDKYWSAKDDDFTVVQNRAFTKAQKFFVNLSSGIPINDPYSTGTLLGVQLGYHFSERWGLQFNYLKATYKDNDATSQFITDHGTVPNHNILNSNQELQLNWVPFYAKMSFLDKKIIYFDMGLGVILGQASYTQTVFTGDRTAQSLSYGLSLYQHFFFAENWAIKVDFRNTFTNEERFRYRINAGESESARSLGSKVINDSALMLGLTFFH